MKLDDTTTCSAAELAWMLGCTDRAVRGYANRGLAVRAGRRGKYLLGESVRRIHHHLREGSAGRSGNDLAEARSKLTAAQTEAQLLRNATLRGEVLPKVDVIDTWRVLLRGVCQMALAWPGKVAFELPVIGVAERAVLERVVRDDLADCALARGYFNLGDGDIPAKDAQP